MGGASRLDYRAQLHRRCAEGALTWFDEARANRDRYLVAYDRLNRMIEKALKTAVPEALWWPSSPASRPLDFERCLPGTPMAAVTCIAGRSGTRKGFFNYRDVRPRFCSKFGFQSYTSMPVIRGFAEEKDFNIAAPVIEWHQKNASGNERIAATMLRSFRFRKGISTIPSI